MSNWISVNERLPEFRVPVFAGFYRDREFIWWIFERYDEDEGWCWARYEGDLESDAFEFLDNNYEFRLKPRTITINGIEVPAPFEPRDGELVFVLDNFGKDGFTSFNFDGVFFSINFGA